MRPYILCSLLVATLVTSCLGPQEKQVSKEEAMALSRQIDSSISSKNADLFLSLIQQDVFVERIGKAGNTKITRGLKKGLEAGMKSGNMGGQIINVVADGKGTYQLVKHYEKEGKHHLIYRLYGEQGLNYHDFELTKVGSKVYIADFLIYLTGENFSQSMADLLEGIDDKSVSNAKKAKTAEDFRQIRYLIAQNKHREAKRLFDQFPASFKERKLAQVTYLMINSGLSVEEYGKALDEFEERFRNEPNMYITLIDAYFLQKKYDKAIEVVNGVDSMIKSDPFLDYFRGMIYYNWGKPTESRAALENLYKNYPEFEAGTIELIHNYLIAKDYEKARTLVAEFRKNEHFNQELLDTNLAVYPDFDESATQ